MLDMFEDSCDGLEIDRVKDKIRAIWGKIIVAEYNNEFGHMKDDHEDYKTLEQYMTENQLYFPGDDKPEDETTSIVKMLEELFDDKEELDPIKGEGNAPTYGGKNLTANNEGSTIETTTYSFEFGPSTKTKDSQTSVKSGTYKAPSGGKLAANKSSRAKAQYKPMVEKIVEELLDLEKRQGIGRRRQLFRP